MRLSLSDRATSPSGMARRMSSSLRAATVVATLSLPTPHSACVVIWISMSVERKETLDPDLRISRLARIGRVWRRSTMPLTICSGRSRLSREVLTNCIEFILRRL
ncbi:hypothetical protein D9M71_688990 [compost metagenome]